LGGRPLPTPPGGPVLEWKWSRFSSADYIVAGAGGAITLATAIIVPRSTHSLSGSILFDDAARRALRPRSLQTRYDYRDASDVGLSLAVTWPFFADALVSAWWYRGSRDVAQEMALINLEALAITGTVQGVTNVLISRERPYGQDCGSSELPKNSLDCDGSSRYRSFFSGHSSFSFTSAALICMDHFENELLGEPWDALSCAGGYAVAATTATFRVVGDVHYASDVITGALIGTVIGYGVPLLHYRHHDLGSVSAAGMKLQLLPSANGMSVLGVF
jgi:membrane-associated phospholipid phosphatase